jgi:hypothetical protein
VAPAAEDQEDGTRDTERRRPAVNERVGRGQRHIRKRAPRRPSAPESWRRLGPLEYALIALIVLGIGITVAMAILNP